MFSTSEKKNYEEKPLEILNLLQKINSKKVASQAVTSAIGQTKYPVGKYPFHLLTKSVPSFDLAQKFVKFASSEFYYSFLS